MNKVLICEISGKRPGGVDKRPTEKFKINYDKVIISNNSQGYDTEWDIVNVPEDYKEWYIKNHKNSDNAWYAPMNRSYAIKYAKEKGYKYLIQLDDNINQLQIAYILNDYKDKNIKCKRIYRSGSNIKFRNEIFNDFIDILVNTLETTNAGMAGFSMCSAGMPDSRVFAERYVYSFFGLDLDRCPEIFQGDFEDDIEYRLKLTQMGIPVIQICPLQYSKVGQAGNKDLSGCRAEYLKAGVKRGEHMSKLYGDIYSAGMRNGTNRVGKKRDKENIYFKHKIKPIKLGIIIKDRLKLYGKINEILEKYATEKSNKIKYDKREKV